MSFTVIIFRQNTILKNDSESDFPCEIPKNLKHFYSGRTEGALSRVGQTMISLSWWDNICSILKFAIFLVETWSKKLTRSSYVIKEHIPNSTEITYFIILFIILCVMCILSSHRPAFLLSNTRIPFGGDLWDGLIQIIVGKDYLSARFFFQASILNY